MRRLIGLAVVLAVATSAPADVLWDNNIIPNGSGGRAISPPSFPNIRVADDFVVPRDSDGWIVEDIHYNAWEDANWSWDDGDGIEVAIYEDRRNLPGAVIATRSPGGSKMATGKTFFGRKDYAYWAVFENDPVRLGPGRYWVSVRHATAGGVGTNYWATSDGGPSGGGNFGAFSLDSGNTWRAEPSPTYHHAFTVTGREIPEPTTLALLALGGLAALRRRTGL